MNFITQLPGNGQDLSHAIKTMLEACAETWARELRQRPVVPLYRSGVRYEPEPWGGDPEEWAPPPVVLRRGWGDCDDLVMWRVAELRAAGEPATVQVMRRGVRYHVRVRRADGRVEDPSLILMERKNGQ